jgi:hypothetical protein
MGEVSSIRRWHTAKAVGSLAAAHCPAASPQLFTPTTAALTGLAAGCADRVPLLLLHCCCAAAAADRASAGLPSHLRVDLTLTRQRLFPRPLGRSCFRVTRVAFRARRVVFAPTREVRATGGRHAKPALKYLYAFNY